MAVVLVVDDADSDNSDEMFLVFSLAYFSPLGKFAGRAIHFFRMR